MIDTSRAAYESYCNAEGIDTGRTDAHWKAWANMVDELEQLREKNQNLSKALDFDRARLADGSICITIEGLNGDGKLISSHHKCSAMNINFLAVECQQAGSGFADYYKRSNAPMGCANEN